MHYVRIFFQKLETLLMKTHFVKARLPFSNLLRQQMLTHPCLSSEPQCHGVKTTNQPNGQYHTLSEHYCLVEVNTIARKSFFKQIRGKHLPILVSLYSIFTVLSLCQTPCGL